MLAHPETTSTLERILLPSFSPQEPLSIPQGMSTDPVALSPADLALPEMFAPGPYLEARPVSADEVASRIEVRPPYLALDSISADTGQHGAHSIGRVRAFAPVERPGGPECGPITSAEAGRHLAILGSIAASLVNPRPERHFYLAHQATLIRHEQGRPGSGPLHVSAQSRLLDKRSAGAHALLHHEDGALAYDLSVRYHVLSAAAFDRLYRDRRRELRLRARGGPAPTPEALVLLRQMRANPYRQPPPLGDIRLSPERIDAALGPVPERLCAGHFPLYPALPVAILVGCLLDLAGNLLRLRLGGKGVSYVVPRLDLRADNLAFAGDNVTLSAEWCGTSPGGAERFRCCAWAVRGDEEPRLAGDMIALLTPIGNA